MFNFRTFLTITYMTSLKVRGVSPYIDVGALPTVIFDNKPGSSPGQDDVVQLRCLCQEIKQFGSCLEESSKDQLDLIQLTFTELCQNKLYPMDLRLLMLEVVEKRTLGWKIDEKVENYYAEKFKVLDSSNPRLPPSLPKNNHSKLAIVQSGNVQLSTDNSRKTKGYNEPFYFSGSKLSLASSDVNQNLKAMEGIESHEKTGECDGSLVQYSKDALLKLSSSPLCRRPPGNWNQVVTRLPSILLRNVMRSDLHHLVK